mgnify:CR=1
MYLFTDIDEARDEAPDEGVADQVGKPSSSVSFLNPSFLSGFD